MRLRSQRDCCSIPSATEVLQVPEASKTHGENVELFWIIIIIHVNAVHSACGYC